MSDIYHQRNFVELLLRHLFLSPVVLKKAKTLKLTSEDFLPVGEFQLPAYMILAGLALEIGEAPIDLALVLTILTHRSEQKLLPPNVVDELFVILGRIYTTAPVMDTYYLEVLAKFIRARRSEKILSTAAGDIARIHSQYQKVIMPLDTLNESDVPIQERFVKPLGKILKKTIQAMVSTGFTGLDAALGGGLGYREFGLLIGHSGGGKTATGVSFARGAAVMGHKVIYCSMEEEKEDIANRLYASIFNIDYTSLHNGSGYMELDQKVADGDEAKKMAGLDQDLVILDLKGLTPIKASTLKQLVDDYAVANDFAYELLIIDQLQFMEPETAMQGEQEWQREGRIVTELDAISHQAINGFENKYFAMWALHQARGKVKIYFTTDEIAGFKGIVHKPETVLGIGRENPTSSDFELFSLKNRHAKNFRLPMYGDLTFMTFIEKTEAAPTPCGPSASPALVPSLMTSNYGAPEMAQLLSTGPPTPPALSEVGI